MAEVAFLVSAKVDFDTVHRQARVKRFPYRIVFQVAGDRITVVAIAHHSRRPGCWRLLDG